MTNRYGGNRSGLRQDGRIRPLPSRRDCRRQPTAFPPTPIPGPGYLPMQKRETAGRRGRKSWTSTSPAQAQRQLLRGRVVEAGPAGRSPARASSTSRGRAIRTTATSTIRQSRADRRRRQFRAHGPAGQGLLAVEGADARLHSRSAHRAALGARRSLVRMGSPGSICRPRRTKRALPRQASRCARGSSSRPASSGPTGRRRHGHGLVRRDDGQPA